MKLVEAADDETPGNVAATATRVRSDVTTRMRIRTTILRPELPEGAASSVHDPQNSPDSAVADG